MRAHLDGFQGCIDFKSNNNLEVRKRSESKLTQHNILPQERLQVSGELVLEARVKHVKPNNTAVLVWDAEIKVTR